MASGLKALIDAFLESACPKLEILNLGSIYLLY